MPRQVYDHETGLPIAYEADADLRQISYDNVQDGSALAFLGNDRIWHHVYTDAHAHALRFMGYDVRKVWVE
jgi:hypothetical protein